MGILDYFNTAGGYDPNQKTKEQESLLGKLPNVFMTPNFAETGDITESQQKSLESQSKKAGYGLALVDFLTRQRNLGAKSALPYIGEAFKTGFGGAQDMYRTGLAQNLRTKELALRERFGLGAPYYSTIPTESGYMVMNNRTGKYELMTDESGQPILPAAYSPELQGDIVISKTTAEDIAKKGITAGAARAELDRAESLLKGIDPDTGEQIEKPTGSKLGALQDVIASSLGTVAPGQETAARLRIIGDTLINKVPRMEGPQSDFDRKNYERQAGRLGDPTLSIAERLSALKEVKRIMTKYESLNQTDAMVQNQGMNRELSSQELEAYNWANANPNDPRSAQILQKLGK